MRLPPSSYPGGGAALPLMFVVLLASAGCSRAGSWSHKGEVSGPFTAHSVVATSTGAVLVAGYRGYQHSGINSRAAMIYRIEGRSLVVAWNKPGRWIQVAAGLGDAIWAVQATLRADRNGSTYELLTSEDGGRTWKLCGAIPARSVTDLALVNSSSGWVGGAGDLWQTTDRGVTWQRVGAPGGFSGVAASLVVGPGGDVLLGGRSLRRSADSGKTWRTISRAKIQANDLSYVVSSDKLRLRVGRLEGGAARWLGEVKGYWSPITVGHVGSRVVAVASEVSRPPGRVYLLVSKDGGQTLAKVRGASGRAVARVAQDGKVWLFGGRGRLKVWAWR